MDKIDLKLKEIIKYHIGDNDIDVVINDDTNIFKEFSLDSIQIINIIADIEIFYNIHLSMDNKTLEALKKYKILKEFIKENINKVEIQNV